MLDSFLDMPVIRVLTLTYILTSNKKVLISEFLSFKTLIVSYKCRPASCERSRPDASTNPITPSNETLWKASPKSGLRPSLSFILYGVVSSVI